MALLAAQVAHFLEEEGKAVITLNPFQQEFLCWLIEKHLGRRSLVRLAYRLQQVNQIPLPIPEQFKDIYPSDTPGEDVWGLIGESSELVNALGFEQINLLLDLNEYELNFLLDDLVSFFTHLDLLEHPGWLVRAALPRTDMTHQLLGHITSHFYPIYLEYPEAQLQEVVSRHLQVATDGRYTSLASMVETAVLELAKQEIQTLYGDQTLAGWVDWVDTLLKLAIAGSEFNDKDLSEADKATLTFYKRHILLRLDETKQGVWRGPQFISLEGQPFELMKKLFELRGHPSPDTLFQVAGSVANLNTLASRLREKVEPVKGKTNIYLHNRRDQGYWLENISL